MDSLSLTMTFVSILWMLVLNLQEVPQIEVYQVEKPGYVEIWARNPHVYPVTIELTAELENLSSDKLIPHTDVLSPESNSKLVRLDPINDSSAWNFDTRFVTYKGDVFAQHQDDYAYQFPYRIGSSHLVSQAYHGDFSHSGSAAYSIDFAMPEGTQIYAARAGVVIEVVQRFNDGGNDKSFIDKANFVTILHADGTMADYSHLRLNGARVAKGDEVKVGQFLGFSGATGFVTGPHLHIGIKKTVLGGKYETIQVKFATINGPVTPTEGMSYTAY